MGDGSDAGSGEGRGSGPSRTRRGKWFVVAFHVAGVVLLGAEIGALAAWGEGAWDRRLGVVTGLVAFYGVSLGFIARSEALRRFGEITDQMTSPNLVVMFVGNTVFMALLCQVLVVGLEARRVGPPTVLGVLGRVLLMPVAVVFFAYVVFHFLVLMPVAWAAYVLAGGLMESVLASGTDGGLTARAADGTEETVGVKALLSENPAAVRSFLVGIPSAAVSVTLNVVGQFS